MMSRHQETLEKLGGFREFSRQLVEMYLDRRFAENGRSQEGIRLVVRSLKSFQPDDSTILSFFEGNMSYRELEKAAKATTPNEEGSVVAGCTAFINVLLNLNTKRLTEDEINALKRTAMVLNSVFSEVSA